MRHKTIMITILSMLLWVACRTPTKTIESTKSEIQIPAKTVLNTIVDTAIQTNIPVHIEKVLIDNGIVVNKKPHTNNQYQRINLQLQKLFIMVADSARESKQAKDSTQIKLNKVLANQDKDNETDLKTQKEVSEARKELQLMNKATDWEIFIAFFIVLVSVIGSNIIIARLNRLPHD